MFYVVVWSMLITMIILCLYEKLMQAYGSWELYIINSREGLIFMLLLDHDWIMLFPFDY